MSRTILYVIAAIVPMLCIIACDNSNSSLKEESHQEDAQQKQERLRHFYEEYAALNREHQELEMERRDYQDYFDTLQAIYLRFKPQPEPELERIRQSFQTTMKEDSDMISSFVKEIDKLQDVINRYEREEITYQKAEEERRVLDREHQKIQDIHEKILKDLERVIADMKALVEKVGGKDKIPPMTTKNRDTLKASATNSTDKK